MRRASSIRSAAALLLLLGAAGLAALVAASSASEGQFLFLETFQGPDPLGAEGQWVKSNREKYAGQPVAVTHTTIPGFEHEKTLILQEPMKHYGVASVFNQPVANGEGEEFVLQYEVKMEEPLTCGGAYVKLFAAETAPSVGEGEFDNETPYILMFGPDRCGATNKVHFILRHRNPVSGAWEEKHAEGAPQVKVDKKSHVYTLVIRPDNSFDIYIDGTSERSGSLLEDMAPPVNPPAEIDDPSDSKPADWVDEATIPDPDAVKPPEWDEDAPAQVPDMDATKPEGWLDDEPEMVADPEAAEPDDWDEEEDGAWEAPVVFNPKCQEAPGCGEWTRPMKRNPEYKGKWSAPLVDNPAYKGVWAPRQIPNPAFFKDEAPCVLPAMSALAVEVWTTNGGIRMDNFVVGHDAAAALAYAEEAWRPKYAAEAAAEAKAIEANKADGRAARIKAAKEAGGWTAVAKVYALEALEAAKAKPLAAGGTLGALLVSALYLLSSLRGGSAKEEEGEEGTDEGKAVGDDANVSEDEDDEEEDEEEEEEEEEEDKPKKRATRSAKSKKDD